ncbi:MAG TPA: VOC family protein [Edaphobacter sp.]|nr:VOC family protein [Edaphobacter sp.]
MPESTVIPVLAYPDVHAAVDWLCGTFGFTLRLRIGSHRAQLKVGDGAVVIGKGGAEHNSGSVMVRVDDIDTHYARAIERGAHVPEPPANYPYGERQYTAEDLAGHRWTFSQSIADVDPADWGGTLLSR